MHVEPETPIKVAIAIPCGDEVKAVFAMSLVTMVNHTHTARIPGLNMLGILNYRTTVLPDSRNALAKKAIEGGFTHILWIDSDMKFPHDMLERLLQHRVDFVGINASMRRPPYRTTVKINDKDLLVTNKDSTGLEKVQSCGLGVVLHTTAVLKRLKKRPWFSFEYLWKKDIHRGEDYFFCKKVKRAGFEIYVDQDLSKEVGHVGEFVFYPGMGEVTE